jgi:hypothetical protein
MVVTYTGVVVIAVGLILMLVGVAITWKDYRAAKDLGPAKFLEKLSEFAVIMAKSPPNIVLFSFGTLLVFLGGIIAGVGGLV